MDKIFRAIQFAISAIFAFFIESISQQAIVEAFCSDPGIALNYVCVALPVILFLGLLVFIFGLIEGVKRRT